MKIPRRRSAKVFKSNPEATFSWLLLLKLRLELISLAVHEMPLGYPQLGAFLDSDDNFMVFRRFGYLQSRLLLDKQDDLRKLEEQLDRLDASDTETTGNEELLDRRRNFGAERLELLKVTEEKWLQYCAFPIHCPSRVSIRHLAYRPNLF